MSLEMHEKILAELIMDRTSGKGIAQRRKVATKKEVVTPLDAVTQMNTKVDKLSKFYPVDEKNWRNYVCESKLEIACGEAPFMANSQRTGFLDRKLIVVSRYCGQAKEWMTWAKLAYRACYGYEIDGDKLMKARENLLRTFVTYYEANFPEQKVDLEYPGELLGDLVEIAEIISWNVFQMDGLTYRNGYGEEVRVMDWEKGEASYF